MQVEYIYYFRFLKRLAISKFVDNLESRVKMDDVGQSSILGSRKGSNLTSSEDGTFIYDYEDFLAHRGNSFSRSSSKSLSDNKSTKKMSKSIDIVKITKTLF